MYRVTAARIDVAVAVIRGRLGGAFCGTSVAIAASRAISKVSSVAAGRRLGRVTLGTVVNRGAPGGGYVRCAAIIVTGGCITGRPGAAAISNIIWVAEVTSGTVIDVD